MEDTKEASEQRKVPIFTVLKKGTIVKNIFLFNAPQPDFDPQTMGFGENLERSSEQRDGEEKEEILNEENQRSKGMLNQVSNNYNTLQMHLVSLMQQQNQKSEERDEMIEDKLDDKKHEVGDGVIVPRQSMDLGLAATAEMEENSQTSSEERRRDHSRSPINNLKVVFKNNEIFPFNQAGKKLNRDDSTDHESQGWVPNKTPKLNGPSKNVLEYLDWN